ncbi:hypothetical protein K435DRAFT_835320 [Dendrothele bispora CBS 962.96]|uniref:Uncharacterized protein n=1 Tax=Dendrothele bispora (strain CBS 962.96) TaxID=1314807 RepID=A0A4V4HHZ8_DENBC|nr:hypothetical protein K435DRAFT_835320 [Dendrothele bispora CBS 962.96]
MNLSTVLKIVFSAIALVASAEAAANSFPVQAVGDIVAVRSENSKSVGATHVFFQDRSGVINRLCTTDAFVRGGTQDPECTPQRNAVPADEVLFGTPLAAVTLTGPNGGFAGNHAYFIKPDFTLGEYNHSSSPKFGTGCTTCIDNEKFQVQPGSTALYAIATTEKPAFQLRVGFVSAASPGTVTEATYNANTQKWSLATMPN